ncbi:hypothetical protein IJ579_09200 [bacterium]|nr:hypothetical protein [bacterium]
MAITAVSSVKADSGFKNVSFGNRPERDDIPEVSHSSGNIKTIPVVMLMAMNPSLLSAANNIPVNEFEPNEIEISAPTQNDKIDEDFYVTASITPQTPQKSKKTPPPYGWEYFRYDKVKYSKPIKIYEDPGHLVYTTSQFNKKSNEVENVFLITDGNYGSKRASDHPPKVQQIIFHDLGEGKEFYGAVTIEDVVNCLGDAVSALTKEIYLDKSVAEEILKLLNGQTQWTNKTHISYKTTTSPKFFKSILTQYY